jgi:hypothetical protein
MKQHDIYAVSIYFYWFQKNVTVNDQIKLIILIIVINQAKLISQKLKKKKY